jgi:hypothetical protein
VSLRPASVQSAEGILRRFAEWLVAHHPDVTFEPTGDGFTLMTMQVGMPEPEDPETFMEQSAAGLTSSLATLDELVST